MSRYKSSQFADAWRDDADTYRSPVSPADLERAKDETYANDYAALVAIFRTQTAGQTRAVDVAAQLRDLAALLIDRSESPASLFPQQCLTDHGPSILLRALATAYLQPAHVLGDLEGD